MKGSVVSQLWYVVIAFLFFLYICSYIVIHYRIKKLVWSFIFCSTAQSFEKNKLFSREKCGTPSSAIPYIRGRYRSVYRRVLRGYKPHLSFVFSLGIRWWRDRNLAPASSRGASYSLPFFSDVVLSRNEVRPPNFCNFLKVHITILLELFGSQEDVLRFQIFSRP